jgi:hypothetical protein
LYTYLGISLNVDTLQGTLFGRLLSPMAGAEPDFARDALAIPGMVMEARKVTARPVLNIVSTAALHHLSWPHVGVGSISAAEPRARRRRMLLRKRTPKSDFQKNSAPIDENDRVGSPLVLYFEVAAISAPPQNSESRNRPSRHVVAAANLRKRVLALFTSPDRLFALVRCELRLATHLDAVRLGPFTAFAGAGADQLALELGKPAKHGQDQAPVRRGGVLCRQASGSPRRVHRSAQAY